MTGKKPSTLCWRWANAVKNFRQSTLARENEPMANNVQAAQSNPATLLVVDDNKGVLEFLVLLLTKHGYKAIGAGSGRECIDIVRQRTVDLIISDVMMPTMNGLQLCQELKSVAPLTPVILLTARDDMATRAAAMDLGVSEFVTKPVNNNDLLNRVRTQLSNLEWDKTADQVVSRIEKSAAAEGKTP
jgi:DNA-binding response OmpR family regulator